MTGTPPLIAAGSHPKESLDLPQTVAPIRVRWHYAFSIVLLHAVALLAFLPWFFTWTGLIVCVLGFYVFGTLGINLCYHRLLTHRAFTCPVWLERTLAILGLCCLQEAPGRWVAIHRKHHQHSDEQPDPHSPLVAFLWGHVGWLVIENRDTESIFLYQRYARDILHQPFYLWLEKKLRWLWVYLAHALVFAAVGFVIGFIVDGTLADAGRFAASVVLWGVVVRTVLVWHITWSVNSLSHLFGYQSHDTGENSRNNWFVALISNGEGWHNNHHADQRCAAHGWRWWEFDVTYLTIMALEKLGVAGNVMRPGRRESAAPR
ncbi:MAG: delta 9 acyl-lipid fatty acid desaturase [Phycisphaerae bacterium]|nr:MAG: delta 9 acyl-lipid fatty acid desaturase [Phycisphaerae bacterium]